MAFDAKVVLDSISEDDARLVTFELTYPLIVHNEFLTHRMVSRTDSMWLDFSRNASSNRALPSNTLVQQVLDDPYIPPEFRRSTRGMVAGEPLDQHASDDARRHWLRARDAAVQRCRMLEDTKVHKQWRNRLLMPFQWITVVATANAELWEHFFRLRDHPAAQPDIAHVAGMAHEHYRASAPDLVCYYGWHLPYITWEEWAVAHIDLETAQKVSVARCARTSYLRQGELVPLRDDLRLYDDLTSSDPPHESPLEHVATPALIASQRCGNVIGWIQLRHYRPALTQGRNGTRG